MRKTSIVSVAFLALLMLVVASCASAVVIFQDDFNDGNKNGWTDTLVAPWYSDPGTSVVDGKLVFANLGVSLADALNGVENVDITVDVPLVGQSQVIVLRYKDASNWVGCWYNKDVQQIYVFQITGGFGFYSRTDTPDMTAPVSLHARVVGAFLTFGVTDGTHSYALSHMLPSGLLGPGNHGLMATTEMGPVHFDNFVASTPPPSGTVTGRVTNSETANRVIGANVSLIFAGARVINTVTDNNGDYTIQSPEGDYTLEVRAAAYDSQTKPVTISSGGSVTADVQLDPVPVIFQDDFNDGNKNGWTDTLVAPWYSDPGTSVVDGKLVFANLGVSLADALNGVEDVDITVDVPLVGQSQLIVLRYKDASNWVGCWYNKSVQQIYVFQVTGGWGFYSRTDTPDMTAPVSLHARVVGAVLTFEVTDGPHSYALSHTLPSGLLGPGNHGLMATTETGPVHFDNFVASTPPSRGTVTGKITDAATEAPVIGARVIIAVANGTVEAVTNDNGDYTLEVPSGDYSVMARANGYIAQVKPVTATAGEVSTVDFQLLSGPTGPATFYVKTDGDDSKDGLSPENAWLTIDRGDFLGVLRPGSTVVIMAGDYTLAGNPGVNLSYCPGTAELPITYKAEGAVNIALPSAGDGIGIGVDHVVFDGLTFTGASTEASPKTAMVAPNGRTGIEIKNCKTDRPSGSSEHGPYGLVFLADCVDVKVHHNVCLNGFQAIQLRGPAGALVCNNTCVGNFYNSIGVWGAGTSGTVVKNNIISGNQGLSAMLINDVAAGACDFGYNTFFDYNVAEQINGTYYDEPIGPGETTADPMLDESYRLMPESPCVDAGVNVGLPFLGVAPDRGAFEILVTSKVGDIYGAPVGDIVHLATCVVTAGSGVFSNDALAVEDESRAAGILVQSNPNLIPVDEGARIAITGTVAALNGVKVIIATDIDYLSSGAPLTALGMTGKSVVGQGLKNYALLVKTWGKVRVIPGVTDYFLIDDGSGKNDGNGNAGLPVVVSETLGGVGTWPADGSYVSVVGIAGVADLGGGMVSVVLPRGAADIH